MRRRQVPAVAHPTGVAATVALLPGAAEADASRHATSQITNETVRYAVCVTRDEGGRVRGEGNVSPVTTYRVGSDVAAAVRFDTATAHGDSGGDPPLDVPKKDVRGAVSVVRDEVVGVGGEDDVPAAGAGARKVTVAVGVRPRAADAEQRRTAPHRSRAAAGPDQQHGTEAHHRTTEWNGPHLPDPGPRQRNAATLSSSSLRHNKAARSKGEAHVDTSMRDQCQMSTLRVTAALRSVQCEPSSTRVPETPTS